VRAPALADGARAIDASVRVEVDAGLEQAEGAAAAGELDLRDPAALDVARGALAALRALRASLGEGS
jgi:hypothetical protein